MHSSQHDAAAITWPLSAVPSLHIRALERNKQEPVEGMEGEKAMRERSCGGLRRFWGGGRLVDGAVGRTLAFEELQHYAPQTSNPSGCCCCSAHLGSQSTCGNNAAYRLAFLLPAGRQPAGKSCPS